MASSRDTLILDLERQVCGYVATGRTDDDRGGTTVPLVPMRKNLVRSA